MFVTGPDVVKSVTHEDVTFEELGGAIDPQHSKSGVCHFAAENEADCLLLLRELLELSSRRTIWKTRPSVPTTDDPLRTDAELDTIIPDNPTSLMTSKK